MTCEVKTVPPETTASEAAHVMAEQGIRHLVVSDDGTPLGVFSERDLLRHTIHQLALNQNLGSTSVRDIANRAPITVRSDATLTSVSHLLASHKIGCVPVVDSDHVVGIVSVVDVLRHFGGIDSDGESGDAAGDREQSMAEIRALVADLEMAKAYYEAHGATLVAWMEDRAAELEPSLIS